MIKPWLELTKFRLSFTVALSAWLTVGLPYGEYGQSNLVFISVLLLSLAACALNEIQEVKLDSIMNRTKNRPLPTGLISMKQAYISVFILVVLALITGYILLGSVGVYIYLFTILWYNGIYTPMKRLTSLALVVGALLGTIPIVIGWLAGGGQILDSRLFLLSSLYALWQIPHFLLLTLVYADDYEKAGFLTVRRYLSLDSLKNITFAWGNLIFAWALLSSIIFGFYIIELFFIILALILISFTVMLKLFFKKFEKKLIYQLFFILNIFMVSFHFLLWLDRIW